jgi:peptidoglycan lytic transglycosylase G
MTKPTTTAKKARQPRPQRSYRGCGRFFAFLLLLALALGAAGYWGWSTLDTPYQGFTGSEKWLVVEPGTPARQILEQLEAAGVIADARLARAYLRVALAGESMKAGEYAFRGPATTPQVLDKLVRGEVEPHSVTLVEGLTLAETATELSKAGFGTEAALLAEMRSPALIADLDPQARDLEGYLFPDTYRFARGTPAKEVVATLVRTFRQRFERDVRPSLPALGAPSLHDLVTLASIVEKEARMDYERPLIAAVYRNRLDQGIGLYADPTVIYALKLAGRWDGNIRKDDLDIDSPYNTYRNAGLPPGPIGSPGLGCLAAAARPSLVPYLYFVSKNDGTHVFASTLAEHNANVDRWQKRYWREKWAAESGAAAK